MEERLNFAHADPCELMGNLCRICLTENALQSKCLHEALPDGSLASMVMAVARVEIHSQDGLPDTICGDCLGELEAAHGFRLKCERSDGLLRRLYPKEPPDDALQPTPVKEEDASTPQVKTECDIEYDYESNDNSDGREEIGKYTSGAGCNKNNSRKVSVHLKTKSKVKNSSRQLNESKVKIEKYNGDIDKDTGVSSVKKKTGKKGAKTKTTSFICDICGRPMSSKVSLENHKLRMHNSERRLQAGYKTGYGANKRFHCTECPYSTPYTKAILYHSRTHTGDKPHKCQQCSACFSQPGSLKKHATTHSDQMHYTCPICEKQFKQQNKLSRHQKVHSEDRPHVCSMCNKGFKSKESLTIHIKRHLNIRDYSCEQCGATFVSLPSLISHSDCHLTTKNFECDFCGVKTKSKKRMVMHMVCHTERPTFKCPLCEFVTLSKYSLNTHMGKHTGEKKYSCPICHLKVTRSTGVNRHMLSAHGIQYRVNDHTDRRLVK